MRWKMRESKLSTLLDSEETIDLKLSYSRISDFDRNGPKALLDKAPTDGQGLKMGSLIDDMTFDEQRFNERYYISSANEPTATLGTLAGIITRNYESIPDKTEILAIIKRSNLWSNIKNEETLIAKFDTEEFWDYVGDFYKRNGRVLITRDEKAKADEIAAVIKEHEYSRHIFDEKLEHFYQYKFEITVKQFQLRGILDVISVDHVNKTVAFIDLKTGAGSSDEFVNSFIKYRYYLQAGVYQLAFEQIATDLSLEGYTLKPFEFLYVSLKDKIPMRYIVTDKWLDSALNGFKTTSGYTYKGLYELLDDIYFHWKNKIYDISKTAYENKGMLDINDTFIL